MALAQLRIFLGIGLALLFACAPALAQDSSSSPGLNTLFSRGSPTAAAKDPKCCLGDPNLKIEVGEQARGYGRSHCIVNGQYVDDIVKERITGAPSADGEKPPLLDPDTIHTSPPSNDYTTITIFTTTDTKPDVYTIAFRGQSTLNKDCKGEYTPAFAPLTVAPKINGDKEVWWFNKRKPPNWNDKTRITLTAQPAKKGPYTWHVKAGTKFAELLDPANPKTRGAKVTTKDNKVFVEGLAGSKDKKGDVKITVEVNSINSEPHIVVVKQPAALKPLPDCSFQRPQCDAADASYGYSSLIPYKIVDQFDADLPNILVPLNEKFTSKGVYDYGPAQAQCNVAAPPSPPCWRQSDDCGSTHVCPDQFPKNWVDEITGEDNRPAVGFVPLPQTPRGGNTKVQHWTGQWAIGGSKPGQGVRVQTNWWQKYRDHGIHSHIVSPAP